MEGESKKRIGKILKHDLFIENLLQNEKSESGRAFCHHDMEHFLAVARIAEILNLKEGTLVEPEMIYAAALLHDIGKHKQYENGTPHERASAELAAPILLACGYDKKEISVILNAIRLHRTESTAFEPGISGLIYRADKMSRNCFSCKEEKKCDWKNGKKNRELIW